MPQWPIEEIHQRAFRAVARGHAATIHSVFVELQVGLAYCQLATTTTSPSWKIRYRDSARVALNQALRVAARAGLESDALVQDEFVAAATLLQRVLAKLDTVANPPTPKMQKPEALFSR